MISDSHIKVFKAWQKDWNKFAREVFHVNLDCEQQAILSAVQYEKMVSVASGTARGKDFIAAVAALCFLYLTPKWNENGELVENTKVALTAPTDRQVGNIMYPEIMRLFRNAKVLPGRPTGYDIRFPDKEWFLTGFKADNNNIEAWTGFHAVNTMFVVTEASGMLDKVFEAIEGNLQGNSRLLLVFNPNVSTGYAARSQKTPRFKKFRLNSLNATNVVEKKQIIPGQVDWAWINDKVESWANPIKQVDFSQEKADFIWDDRYYRPNDLFRVKVLGLFPEVGSDVLIPLTWIEMAQERWKQFNIDGFKPSDPLRLGADIAGMGTDSTRFCYRYGHYVDKFDGFNSGGQAEHMKTAGIIANLLKDKKSKAFIDTIGEGAGVYSRLREQGLTNAFSCKFSEGVEGLTDLTGVFKFMNMRAYLFWAIRDWLNPANHTKACLPVNDYLTEELTEIKWEFKSNGAIQIEPKEAIKSRLGRSPDDADTLANTFYPHDKVVDIHKNVEYYFY
jgi:hypothetical protein